MDLNGIRDFISKVLAKAKSKLSSIRHVKTFSKQGSQTRVKQTNSRGSQYLPHQLIGERSSRLVPLFKDMEANLHRSGLRIGFKPYVSITILTTIIVAVFVTGLVPFIGVYLLEFPLLPSILFGLGCGLFSAVIATIAFYIFPLYRADNMRRNIDNSLAFSANYFAILAGANVLPEAMFRSLSKIPGNLDIVTESKVIVRDMDLFGLDLITALQNASNRTPSKRFKEFLEGFVSTIDSGGNLLSYLLYRSRQYMKLKRVALRKFSDTLGLFSEFYVTLLVAGPLIFVVMLAVMALLGGGDLGILQPALLLNLLTYIGLPIGTTIFLAILDTVTPRW